MVRQFFGYKDFIGDECIYVGIGSSQRVNLSKFTKRNSKWNNVVTKYKEQHHREILVGTYDWSWICKWEIEQIKLEKTFVGDYTLSKSGLKCNFTRGGEGPLGCTRSKETREKIGVASKARTYPNRLGRIQSEETRKKLSLAAKKYHKRKQLSFAPAAR